MILWLIYALFKIRMIMLVFTRYQYAGSENRHKTIEILQQYSIQHKISLFQVMERMDISEIFQMPKLKLLKNLLNL